jgi:adenylate cyclase
MTGRLTAIRASLAVAVALAGVRLLAPAPLELLDLNVLDFRHTLRGSAARGSEVVIVGIDEASLAEIGRWPWPRTRLAHLIDGLTAAGAAVIGLDIIFDQPDVSVDVAALEAAAADPALTAAELLATLRSDLDNDAQLGAALRRSGRVVLGHFYEFTGAGGPGPAPATFPASELSVRTTGGARVEHAAGVPVVRRAYLAVPGLATAAAGAGHVNVHVDPDGVYRRVPLAVRIGERLAPALSLEMLRHYVAASPPTVVLGPDGVQGIRAGSLAVAADGAGQLWVNYLGPPGTFPHLSAADVMAARVPRDALAGKAVLLGFTATGFDKIATPFAPSAPGVELQATALDNMLHGTHLVRPWWTVPAEAALILLFGIAVGVLLRRLGTLAAVALAVGIAAAYLSATQYLFETARLAVGGAYVLAGIASCTLAGAVARALAEEREKRWIRGAFSHYLNPEVTEMLARAPERLRLGGERREITVLFADIRDFTRISEEMPPEVLAELLNEFLGTMTDVVFRHAGLLDKYIGDALMAFWGAPVAAADHAQRCCRAALEMMATLRTLHERWEPLGRPRFDIGIGINTGEVAVGNFGSAQRFSYTAVGDDVNLASRLEGLNKVHGTHVLLSDKTCRAIGDEFVTREIDRVLVKGRVQHVTVHELLGLRAEDRDGALERRAAAYAGALDAYRRAAWEDAIGRLTTLAAANPDDRAVTIFLERCREAQAAAR